jgi:mRNA deadenylase 3'-5' endonuclease subunit Ccr4
MRVVSYNLLADSYIKPSYYPRVDPRHLDPTWRRPAILDRIASFDADVICLQEVEAPVFAALQDRLNRFAGHYAPKDQGKPDGCATFARVPVRNPGRLVYADGSGHIALMVEVELDGRTLGIANTHFRWGPPGTTIGLEQARELLDAIGTGLWVVCGDFNADPMSALVAEFGRRSFSDAYAELDCPTCNANGVAKRIDFIMYRGLACQPDPIPPIAETTPLPSAEQPSDHLPISARFTWD